MREPDTSERGEEYSDIKDSTGAWGETVHRRNEKRGCGRDTWEDPGGKGEENAGPQSKWIIPLVAIRGDPLAMPSLPRGTVATVFPAKIVSTTFSALAALAMFYPIWRTEFSP